MIDNAGERNNHPIEDLQKNYPEIERNCKRNTQAYLLLQAHAITQKELLVAKFGSKAGISRAKTSLRLGYILGESGRRQK